MPKLPDQLNLVLVMDHLADRRRLLLLVLVVELWGFGGEGGDLPLLRQTPILQIFAIATTALVNRVCLPRILILLCIAFEGTFLTFRVWSSRDAAPSSNRPILFPPLAQHIVIITIGLPWVHLSVLLRSGLAFDGLLAMVRQIGLPHHVRVNRAALLETLSSWLIQLLPEHATDAGALPVHRTF